MASGYLYRERLLRRIRDHLRDEAVIVWGPPGYGKTLLLKEAARSLDLPYQRRWRPGRGVFDLEAEPAAVEPGQLLALRRRPAPPVSGVVLIGPEALDFNAGEIAELARRLGAPDCAGEAGQNLGGWPLLVRRGLESGVCRPESEPLRGHLEAILTALGAEHLQLLSLLVNPLPETAWRRAGYGPLLDDLFRGGWVFVAGGLVTLQPALAGYFRATRGLPPLELMEPVLDAARRDDPEAAFRVYLEYGSPEAGSAYEELAAELLAAGDYEKVVRYWELLPGERRTGLGALRAAEAERSRGRLEEALALARWAVAGGGEILAQALNVEGTVLIHMGRYREAVEVLERGLRAAGGKFRYKILAGLGAALIRSGEFRRAVAVLQEAVTLAQAAGDADLLAKVQHNLGIALHHTGRLRQAVMKYREALELKAGAPALTRSNSLLSLGEALRLLGDWQEARRVLMEAAALAEESGEYRAVGYASLNLGDLYLDAGWQDEAEKAYRRAEGVLKPVADRYGLGLLWLGEAALARARGALASAEDALQRAEGEFDGGGSPLELAQVWIERARLRPREAEHWLSRAEAAAAEAGGEYHRLLARALRVAGGGLGEEAALEVAEWVLREDAYPLALAAELFPVWLLAAGAGREGRALLERLAYGYGRYRVHSFGDVRLVGEVEVELPTVGEAWLLLWLWLRPERDPVELFSSSKRPRKRLQLAVHHLRSRLGEEWVRSCKAGYRSRPLPGVWWDAGLLKAAIAAARKGVTPQLRDFVRRLYRGPLAPEGPFAGEREEFARAYEQIAGA